MIWHGRASRLLRMDPSLILAYLSKSLIQLILSTLWSLSKYLRRLTSLRILSEFIWRNRTSRLSWIDPRILAYLSKSLIQLILRTLWSLSKYIRRLISLQILTISDLVQQTIKIVKNGWPAFEFSHNIKIVKDGHYLDPCIP